MLVLATGGCGSDASTGSTVTGPGTTATGTSAPATPGPSTSSSGSSAAPTSAAPTSAAPTSAAPTSAAPTSADAGTVAQGTAVGIEDFEFQPDSLEVRAGRTVTWTNADRALHTVTPTGVPSFDGSDEIVQGATFSATFSEPGTYAYACAIHPTMTGQVVVVP